MLESTWQYIIIRTFPESIILILAGVILLGKKINKLEILKNGLLLGLLITIIRKLPINFGVHTILAMVTLLVLLYNMSDRASFIPPLITTSLIWIALAISEGIYIGLAINVLKIPFEYLASNSTPEGAILTLPSLIILMVIILLFKSIKNKIINKRI